MTSKKRKCKKCGTPTRLEKVVQKNGKRIPLCYNCFVKVENLREFPDA